jgi:hypothetical protein
MDNLTILKYLVFYWCMYLSVRFIVTLYLCVKIYINKEFNLSIGKIFMYGLPFSWSVFYVLCNIN